MAHDTETERLVQRLRDPLKNYFLSFDGSRDLGRGDSFPVSADVPGGLVDRDRFFRSNLGIACWYHAAAGVWVSQDMYEARFPFTSASASTDNMANRIAMVGDFRPFLERFDVICNIGATNNGSNYWDFLLRTFASSPQYMALSTAALPINTNDARLSTIAATQPSGTLAYINMRIGKNGAPSTIECWAILRYRYALT